MSRQSPVIDYGTKPRPRRTWGVAWPVWLLAGGFCAGLACLYWRAMRQPGSYGARMSFFVLFASIGLVALINALRTLRKAG